MTDPTLGLIAIGLLFLLVLLGVPIAFALLVSSVVGLYLLSGTLDQISLVASNAALDGVRDYIFVVVPLFILMGAFMSNSPAAGYLYDTARLLTKKLVGGLGTATVLANGIFGTVTGISIASAAIFARISVPEMVQRGYNLRLALGTVAGSSVLGMLLPPSLLMILYGILSGESIGRLFIAGIVPAVLLMLLYSLFITLLGIVRPEWVGRVRHTEKALIPDPSATAVTDGSGLSRTDSRGDQPAFRQGIEPAHPEVEPHTGRLLLKAFPLGLLISLVLGGIWGGWFTPTEAGAVGAFGALLIAILYGLRFNGFSKSLTETVRTVGAILLLLIGASMFSRTLAQSGLITEMTVWIAESGLSPYAVVVLFVVLLVIMGTVLDSTSILLIMVPLMVPVISALQIDPIWFAVIVIVSVEIGLLTPPFGISAFTMSAVLGPRVKVGDIFIGTAPFATIMLLLIGVLMAFPGLVTWLPSLM